MCFVMFGDVGMGLRLVFERMRNVGYGLGRESVANWGE